MTQLNTSFQLGLEVPFESRMPRMKKFLEEGKIMGKRSQF